MSKTLKRILIILIISIISLLLIPKSNEAYNNTFNLVHSTFEDSRFWCVQMNQEISFSEGFNEYELCKTYHLYGSYYTIDNDPTKYTENMAYLNIIAYISSQGKGDKTTYYSHGSDGKGHPESPFAYSSQFALWYHIKNGSFTDGNGVTFFDSSANSEIEINGNALSAKRIKRQ